MQLAVAADEKLQIVGFLTKMLEIDLEALSNASSVSDSETDPVMDQDFEFDDFQSHLKVEEISPEITLEKESAESETSAAFGNDEADESDASENDASDADVSEAGSQEDAQDESDEEYSTKSDQEESRVELKEDDPVDIVNEKRKQEFFEMPADDEGDDLIDSFTVLRLSRSILKGISDLGFVKPTPIQAKTIPIAMMGKDICGGAVTGSGKTAAFVIPVLERLLFRSKDIAKSRVLILVPTRELGVQVANVAKSLAKYTDIEFCLAVGGLSSKTQELELKKRPDVIIATPGRLIDHIHNSQSFNLDSIEILIMDEADRMLEDGFADELNEIIKHTPKSRQTMLFSATMTDNVDDLIKLSLNRPVRLFVDNQASMAKRLLQEFIRVRAHREDSRAALLVALCSRTYTSEAIIFFRSKSAAHYMNIVFKLLGLKSTELHGNLTQVQRLESLELFREKKVDFLLATDLASRGLDISGIKTVINYEMPRNYSQYVHRVGRTARASKSGRAVSFVGEDDRNVLKLAIKNSKDQIKSRVMPSAVIEKFQSKIKSLEGRIKEVFAEEKDQKELRIADMEASRAENMIIHENEIKSRPARVWFQSETGKAESKALGSAKHKIDFGIVENSNNSQTKQLKRGKLDGLSRKQKRRRLAADEDSQEMVSQKAAARASKASLKPNKILKISESNTKEIPKKNVATKQGSFDREVDNRKKPSAGNSSTKEKKSRPKFKTKNKSKSRHKKRR